MSEKNVTIRLETKEDYRAVATKADDDTNYDFGFSVITTISSFRLSKHE